MQREKGLPNPLDGNSKILAIMEKILSKAQFLNNDFILKEEDFITQPSNNQSTLPTPPLDTQPMPAKTVANTPIKNPQTNLTQTEEALLSPTEKVIAGRT